ncbi:MAG: putative toxin-antitoxin system toxin component, PIN family [Deltaproteobacteria bacterium]|nr:putative toxin-antitoxin system toxin component, PIN family [Deltaproteobacteria bacterium]
MNLNAVFDTNVLISGILWRGIPFKLLRWAEEGSLQICTSLEILAEVHRVLHYHKFQQYIDNQQASPGELFAKIASLCTIIQTDQVVKGVCSDPDDEIFLSCALAANIGVLVSGDKHLLALKKYQNVRILTAREFYQENIHRVT